MVAVSALRVNQPGKPRQGTPRADVRQYSKPGSSIAPVLSGFYDGSQP